MLQTKPKKLLLLNITMEIFFNKEELVKALQIIIGITSKSTSEPIINNVLLSTSTEDSKSVLILSATDYDISFRIRFPIEIKSEGQICVNAHRLYNLVREFITETIHLHITEQNWVYIKGGNSNVKLPGIEFGLFPLVEFYTLSNQFEISSSKLKQIIDQTLFAIGDNQARKNLMGLNLHVVEKNKIQWLAADGYRISQVITEFEEPLSIIANLIIPKKSLVEIRKFLDSLEEDILISFDEGIFQIDSKNLQFKTKLIDGEYPDLRRIIVHSSEYIAEVPYQILTNAVRILSMFSTSKASSMKLTFYNNELFLESEKLEVGEANHKVECICPQEKIVIGFNIWYFLEALNSFSHSKLENIKIHITNPSSPCMFECTEWEFYKTILMPMKIEW